MSHHARSKSGSLSLRGLRIHMDDFSDPLRTLRLICRNLEIRSYLRSYQRNRAGKTTVDQPLKYKGGSVEH
jgi:hypothetical protein